MSCKPYLCDEKQNKKMIFNEDMQGKTPRKESTMARRFLETSQNSSQKGKNGHSSRTRRQSSNVSRSLSSPLKRNLPSLPDPQRSRSPTHHPSEMPTIITCALRNWLADHGLQGFIKVVEAPQHPNAPEMASKLNIETLTDSMVRKKLSLDSTGERQFEILPTELLERYYGKYSLSAKAFRTRDIPDPFFWDVAKFILEVGCAHINAYGMPKHKAGVVLATYEGTKVDWGTITRAALREGFHAFQDGKKLRPIIQ